MQKTLSFVIYHLSFSLAPCLALCLALSACSSDWRDGIVDEGQQPAADVPTTVAFTGQVQASQATTRADGSLVNRTETWFPATRVRTYYYTGDDGHQTEKQVAYSVGLFGHFTGQQTWAAYTAANSGKEPPANFIYNLQASLSEPDTTTHSNQLSYSPLRFFSNTPIAGSATQHEYASFWAYYPYNETDDPGQYGISINQREGQPYGINTTDQTGMGSILFTMHPDASEQSDFMISELQADCNRNTYPLISDGAGGYRPTPVPLRFHHMLAQVRLYALVSGADKMVYLDETYTAEEVAAGATYVNEYGETVLAKEGDRKVDEAKCVRWQRSTDVWDVEGKRRRANISCKLEFNNIHTKAIFTPHYDQATHKTTFTYADQGTLGSATVNHYIMNPYWFKWDDKGNRIMLNDTYMYGHFEDTPAYKGNSADDGSGHTWTTSNPMAYVLDKENLDPNASTGDQHHYNFAQGNIILAVPQEMKDDDVPNVVITATGLDTKGHTVTGRVTINLLQMNLKWESGFIYCYAFIDDDMKPGDDKVRGPESITVVFDPTKHTDQW